MSAGVELRTGADDCSRGERKERSGEGADNRQHRTESGELSRGSTKGET